MAPFGPVLLLIFQLIFVSRWQHYGTLTGPSLSAILSSVDMDHADIPACAAGMSGPGSNFPGTCFPDGPLPDSWSRHLLEVTRPGAPRWGCGCTPSSRAS